MLHASATSVSDLILHILSPPSSLPYQNSKDSAVSLLPAFRQDSTRVPRWRRNVKWQTDESMQSHCVKVHILGRSVALQVLPEKQCPQVLQGQCRRQPNCRCRFSFCKWGRRWAPSSLFLLCSPTDFTQISSKLPPLCN